jgi:hypothetical protein
VGGDGSEIDCTVKMMGRNLTENPRESLQPCVGDTLIRVRKKPREFCAVNLFHVTSSGGTEEKNGIPIPCAVDFLE